jgi:hypothetical protein
MSERHFIANQKQVLKNLERDHRQSGQTKAN